MLATIDDRVIAGALAEFEAEGQTGAPADDLTFGQWLPVVSPEYTWQWEYLRHIRRALRRITDGESKRLIIELPPRHGKSEMVTIRYPVWRMLQDPTVRVVVGSYSQTLANRFSRRSRKIAINAGVRVSMERHAAEEWETESGGVFRAVGVGGGITGQGADLMLIDDPVKNRKEAQSKAYRDTVWDWWTNDMLTRLEPGGSVIIIMTRWHLDDLVGRILASDDAANWEVIRLPALAEQADPLGRSDGAALCPDRYSRDALLSIRRVMGRDFDALFQQNPQPREGGMFKYADLAGPGRLIDADQVPANARRVRMWDTGASTNGDPTAGVLVALAGNVFYVEDVKRGLWESDERRKMQRATAEGDYLKRGAGIKQGQWVEPGSGGKDQEVDFIKLMKGFPAFTRRTHADKESNADIAATQVQAGNVRIVRAKWTSDFIDELTEFNSGAHDDQVDGFAGAVIVLSHTLVAGIGENPLAGYRG